MSDTLQDTRFADEVSRGYDAGNYANAYVSEDLEAALAQEVEEKAEEREELSEEFRHAFILGFFASYMLEEIPLSNREEYDLAYFSAAGKQALACGYFESRADEYAAEQELQD
jgi:hypothetical protein